MKHAGFEPTCSFMSTHGRVQRDLNSVRYPNIETFVLHPDAMDTGRQKGELVVAAIAFCTNYGDSCLPFRDRDFSCTG